MGGHVEGIESPHEYKIRSIGKTLLDPDAKLGEPDVKGSLVELGIGSIFSQAARTIPILGVIYDVGSAAIKTQIEETDKAKQYVAGVEYLAHQNVPGFFVHTVNVNGADITIMVDASRHLSEPDEKPWVWTNADKPADPAVAEAIAAATGKALSDLEAFREKETLSIPERKTAFLQELAEWSAKFAATTTKEERDLLGSAPYPVVDPADVYSQIIFQHDSDLSKKVLYPDPPTPETFIGPLVPETNTEAAPPPTEPIKP